MTNRRLSGDRGSAAVEMALLAPALVLLLLLMVYAGRIAGTKGDVQAAARDGARAASLERRGSPELAARDAVAATLAQRGVACASFSTDILVTAATARVRVDCDINTNILGPLGGIDTSVHATAVEQIDVYRGG